MKFFIGLLGLMVTIFVTGSQSFSLDGHKVYRVYFEKESDISDLFNASFEQFDKIFWLYVDNDNLNAEIVIDPVEEDKFLDLISSMSFQYEFLYKIQDEEMKPRMAAAERVHYDGCKVYKVNFDTEEQFNLLIRLKEEHLEYDFWHLEHLGHFAYIMVWPKNNAEFINILDKYGLKYEVMIDDVEKLEQLVNSIFPSKNIKGGNFANKMIYDGYKVVQITCETDEQYQLMEFMRVEGGLSPAEFALWYLSKEDKFAHFMVDPEYLSTFNERLEKVGLKYEVLVDDMAKALNGENNSKVKLLAKYDGYRVYQLTLDNRDQIYKLNWLRIVAGTKDYSFWKLSETENFAQIMIEPSQFDRFERFFKQNNMKIEIVIDNVQKMFSKDQ